MFQTLKFVYLNNGSASLDALRYTLVIQSLATIDNRRLNSKSLIGTLSASIHASTCSDKSGTTSRTINGFSSEYFVSRPPIHCGISGNGIGVPAGVGTGVTVGSAVTAPPDTLITGVADGTAGVGVTSGLIANAVVSFCEVKTTSTSIGSPVT